MQKHSWKIIIGIIILIIISALVFFLRDNKPTETDTAAESAFLSESTIQITKGSIQKRLIETKELITLKTGDTIKEGETVISGPQSSGLLYFPDGSILHIDENTELTVKSSQYSEESQDISVLLSLKVGRIWSTVISLASSKASWQVETENAIATVRGTSFGSEIKNKTTRFIGSTHSVAIKAKNKDTGEEMNRSETVMNEDEVIEIGETTSNIPLGKKKRGDVQDLDQWIKEREQFDKQLKEEVEKKPFKNQSELRKYYQELQEKRIEDAESNTQKTSADETPAVKEKLVEPKKSITFKPVDIDAFLGLFNVNPTEVREIKGHLNSDLTRTTSDSIKILTSKDISKDITEGSEIGLRFMVTQNGVTKDVTSETRWFTLEGRYIGDIRDNMLKTKIDPSLGDISSVSGIIFGIWEDKENNIRYIYGTRPITIIPSIEETINIG